MRDISLLPFHTLIRGIDNSDPLRIVMRFFQVKTRKRMGNVWLVGCCNNVCVDGTCFVHDQAENLKENAVICLKQDTCVVYGIRFDKTHPYRWAQIAVNDILFCRARDVNIASAMLWHLTLWRWMEIAKKRIVIRMSWTCHANAQMVAKRHNIVCTMEFVHVQLWERAECECKMR